MSGSKILYGMVLVVLIVLIWRCQASEDNHMATVWEEIEKLEMQRQDDLYNTTIIQKILDIYKENLISILNESLYSPDRTDSSPQISIQDLELLKSGQCPVELTGQNDGIRHLRINADLSADAPRDRPIDICYSIFVTVSVILDSKHSKITNHVIGERQLSKLLDEINYLDKAIKDDPKNISLWKRKDEVLEKLRVLPLMYDLHDEEKVSDYYDREHENCSSMIYKLEHPEVLVAEEYEKEAARRSDPSYIQAVLLSELENYNQSISANSSNYSAWYMQGLTYMRLAYNAAFCVFDGTADPETRAAMEAKCKQGLNDSHNYTRAALNSFQSAIKTAGSKVPIYYYIDEGNAFYDLGDYSGAIKSYDMAISKAKASISSEPHNNLYYIWGLYAKARVLEHTNPDEAIECYLMILAANDEYDYRIWKKLSKIYKRQGRYSDAIDAEMTADALREEVKGTRLLPRLPTFDYPVPPSITWGY